MAIRIPYGHQNISEDDINEVAKVLRSDWLTQGPTVERFEKSVAEYCKSSYGVATCNATAALHLACRALDVKVGDTVWTSPNTFVASANCALYCGANIDFVDIDPVSYNMSVEDLKNKLENAAKNNKLPKVVIPVHFAGQSCDMRAIKALAEKYNFRIIEDASHAIGGEYLNKKIGNCIYSDITIFSFHPVKIITTGEGGMALTNDKNLYKKLKLLVTHGITKKPDEMENEYQGPWYTEQQDLGYNYRLTDFQCALGLSQLKHLDEFVAKRHELAKRYDEKLAKLPLVLPKQNSDCYSAYHLYVILLHLEKIAKTKKQIVTELREAGIGAMVHYIPVHTHPYYQKLGFKPGDFPKSEEYYKRAITIPLYPTLAQKDQDFVIGTLYGIVST